MIHDQTISKMQEELNAMADRCRDLAQDLEDLADGLYAKPLDCDAVGIAPLTGFARISRMLHNRTRPELGQMVQTTLTDGTVAKWRVIDNSSMAQLPDSGVRPVVVQLAEILHNRPFSMPEKQRTWGLDNYEDSDLAAWLDDEFARHLLSANDFGCLVSRTDLGSTRHYLWLLSAEEAGFENLEKAFTWYACEDKDQREKRRQLKDSDGDAALWWLRTPNGGIANYVRNVYKDGRFDASHVHGLFGVAPACIIG